MQTIFRGCWYNFLVSRVLMVSSEAAPFAKTGGLADVVGSLPPALRSFGDEVAVVIPRYGSIDLKNARRVWDNLAVHFGPGVLSRSRSTRRRPNIRSTWWIARRSSTARASTANPAWITPTTTSASRSSAAPRWAWPASSSGPTSSIATTGRPAWCPPTCAPPSPPTRPFWAAGRCSPSTTSATRACFRKRRWRRSRWTPPSTVPTAWSSSAASATSRPASSSPTR